MAFNLFPGMGGYSLVARRSGMRLAEELIGTGESHTAEWFQARGLVDVLFEPGDAYKATRTFIDVLRPKLNGTRAMLRARQRVLRLSRSELMDITEDWVEAASPSTRRTAPTWSGWSLRRTGAAPPPEAGMEATMH